MIGPLVSAEQFRRRQYEIKKAVGGNGLGKMSIVNKGGPDGKTFVVSKLSYLRCDLVLTLSDVYFIILCGNTSNEIRL